MTPSNPGLPAEIDFSGTTREKFCSEGNTLRLPAANR
jgi:hypothetical protein